MSAAVDLVTLLDLSDAPPVEARIDLRTGRLAAGAVGAATLSSLARRLRLARRAWSKAGYSAPLSAAIPADAVPGLEADWLDDLAREAGCLPQGLSFELDERALVKAGPTLAEGLRARGWGVALAGDPSCPLPFGGRARALYTELVIEAPEPLDPFLAADGRLGSPLGRRLLAAQEAGLILTARHATAWDARTLAAIGFLRAGGPCAEDAF